jgi:hypothetical protein
VGFQGGFVGAAAGVLAPAPAFPELVERGREILELITQHLMLPKSPRSWC